MDMELFRALSQDRVQHHVVKVEVFMFHLVMVFKDFPGQVIDVPQLGASVQWYRQRHFCYTWSAPQTPQPPHSVVIWAQGCLTQGCPCTCVCEETFTDRNLTVGLMADRAIGSARRGRQRRLRSWWRHEAQSVAALASARHHSGGDEAGGAARGDGGREAHRPAGTDDSISRDAARSLEGCPTAVGGGSHGRSRGCRGALPHSRRLGAGGCP